MMRRKLALTVKIMVFACILALASGCDFHHFSWGSHSGGDQGGGEESDHDGQGTVDHGGGTVDVDNDDSPINGVRVVVPPGAVDEGQTVTIYIDHMGGAPGPIPEGSTQLFDGVSITKDSDHKFNLPVYVYIPYDPSLLGAGDIPGAFYWDATAHKYVALGVKEIDTVNHYIMFTTADLGQYVIMTVPGLASALPAVDSGFTPCTDGFFHPNYGAYDYPGSSSWGLAGFSEWYYSLQKGPEGDGLYGMYRSGDAGRWEDDTTARELISRTFAAAGLIWGGLWSEPDYKLSDLLTGQELILAMTVTGAPQTLVLSGENFGHTVTVYNFDKAAGVFTIYDNNFPCEVVTLAWNPATGFSGYSKAAAYPAITKYSFDSYLTAYGTGELRNLYSGAQVGWDPSKFQTITITSPALDENGSATVPSWQGVTVTGQVTGGIMPAQYLVYNVNGVDGLGGQLVTLGADGSFSFTIPSLPCALNTIQIITSNDPQDALRRVPSAYAGFKEFTLRAEGKTHFFINPGFETGDFTGWNHETRSLCGMELMHPDRNSIQTVGGDPVFCQLQKVYMGNYSARVNDIIGGRHVSSVWQTAVVPTSGTYPELKFFWAAVLEDSDWSCWDRDETQRPTVEVIVKDETAQTELYHQVFNPDDDSYSGWQELAPLTKCFGFDWRFLPWQVAIIDCTGLKGHAVTLKVTVTDSSWFEHGGYVYLDGEE